MWLLGDKTGKEGLLGLVLEHCSSTEDFKNSRNTDLCFWKHGSGSFEEAELDTGERGNTEAH